MSTIRPLVTTEAKLFIREPVSVIFVLAFPALVVLILGGVFDPNDPGFEGAAPSDYYIAAYVGVVLSAVGFIMLPVHLASYRERGVLRRFEASHFPPWALPTAWIIVAAALAVLGMVVMLAIAQVAYGVPKVDHPGATALAIILASLTYLSVGVLLGVSLPNARSAQSVGLALFFPSFLLGGGGPPPDAMPTVMRNISNALPMTQAVRAIQQPWLDLGPSNTSRLGVLTALLVITTVAWIRLTTRVNHR